MTHTHICLQEQDKEERYKEDNRQRMEAADDGDDNEHYSDNDDGDDDDDDDDGNVWDSTYEDAAKGRRAAKKRDGKKSVKARQENQD